MARTTKRRPPIPNRPNGRDHKGHFAKGNPGGPGNPYAKQVSEIRRALLECVTPEDIRVIVTRLIAKAKRGEPWAVRELLDRVIGKPPLYVDLGLSEKIEALEKALHEAGVLE